MNYIYLPSNSAWNKVEGGVFATSICKQQSNVSCNYRRCFRSDRIRKKKKNLKYKTLSLTYYGFVAWMENPLLVCFIKQTFV